MTKRWVVPANRPAPKAEEKKAEGAQPSTEPKPSDGKKTTLPRRSRRRVPPSARRQSYRVPRAMMTAAASLGRREQEIDEPRLSKRKTKKNPQADDKTRAHEEDGRSPPANARTTTRLGPHETQPIGRSNIAWLQRNRRKFVRFVTPAKGPRGRYACGECHAEECKKSPARMIGPRRHAPQRRASINNGQHCPEVGAIRRSLHAERPAGRAYKAVPPPRRKNHERGILQWLDPLARLQRHHVRPTFIAPF